MLRCHNYIKPKMFLEILPIFMYFLKSTITIYFRYIFVGSGRGSYFNEKSGRCSGNLIFKLNQRKKF